MDVVPVLDIRDGIVVHARRGERASYAPLQSRIVCSNEPVAVLLGMLQALDAAKLRVPAAYVADLDAIVAGDTQWDVLAELRRATSVPLWVDAGFCDVEAAQVALAQGLTPVVGSESLTPPDRLTGRFMNRLDELGPTQWMLSLDRDANGPRDPSGLLNRSEQWPNTVIAMDLTRVGSSAGGDGTWLKTCMAKAPDRRWVAAGGVRNRDDLLMLAKLGVSAALVATAIHTGQLQS